MSYSLVQFPTREAEDAFQNSQVSQHRLYDGLAIALPAYLSQLHPQAPSTYSIDVALRFMLALWVFLTSPAHYRRFYTGVLVVLRLWLAVLPLVQLFTPQGSTCSRALILGVVCGNSMIYPLILQLPFMLHVWMTLLGLGTSTIFAVRHSNCCGELHISQRISWILPKHPAPSACAQALVMLHGCGMVLVSMLLLWYAALLQRYCICPCWQIPSNDFLLTGANCKPVGYF